jgi:serine/threonine protein kinase
MAEQEPTKTEITGESARAGVLLKGRYLIERELGSGGFGTVFLARDTQLHNKAVVVKILRDLRDDGWARKKFVAECQALARINHPGVVQVLDDGETMQHQPFLVMQFVDGVALRSAIVDGGMDLSRVARIAEQIGRALTAAHEHGVIHRDLKPENVMLCDLGGGKEMPVLVDFGIATVSEPGHGEPQPTRVAGSYSYMAPEQMSGTPSAASDIYSLGVIAYEMVTGVRPFKLSASDPPMQLWFQQKEGVKAKPASLRPELPEAAELAILKALSFLAQDRYAHACEFGDALAAALRPSVSAVSKPKFSTAASGAQSVEMASVLFLDIVSYSMQPMERQSRLLTELQGIVRGTEDFKIANSCGNLISLPTGDGMAMVFFHDPIAPVRCAMEISEALKQNPALQLRMGVHSGPIYRHADIKDELNVLGGGINIAQRVMDCGDAGHILVSKSVADVLSQLSGWSENLHDLGECQVKHGVTVHLFNVYTNQNGNPALPAKLRGKPAAGQRSRMAQWGLYLIPPLLVTVILRVFLNTSEVTRERPLTFAETCIIFMALLAVMAVILWLKRWIVAKLAR